uniref:BTB domain-containing protein n=1 Tax=Caenorhabditis japonica TaxID=281687 RepID=A0A8R1DK59_CAEJA
MSDNHSFGRSLPEEERPVVETMATISNNFNAINRSGSSDVQHLKELSHCFEQLYMSSEHSDVTLLFDDGTKIASHRLILAVRSTFFRAMLFTGFQESKQKIIALPDTNSTAFRAILKYMYSSKIDFTGVELDILLEYLSLAHRYDLTQLMTAISNYFKEILKNENLCSILNAAFFFQLSELIEYCMQYSDKHADQLLDDPSFIKLTGDSLKELLARDSFFANELKIFNSVRTWFEHNPTRGDALKTLLELVRMPLIPQNELLNFVRPTGLVEADDLLDAIAIQSQNPQQIPFRGCKSLDTNIIPQYPSAQPLSREQSRKYTNDEENTSVFYVDLGKPFIINTILLEMNWKSDIQGFSYDVHVSMDDNRLENWTLVADYTAYDCRGLQRVYFEDRVVRHILIKCADRMATRLEAGRIEAMHSTETMPVDPVSKIIIPQQNIATVQCDARVVEGVSRCRNALINGDITSYDWDSGYTCHQIGSGLIMIQLAQPFIISSMRILLWNCDDRFYSYYVAVSTNQTDWMTVVDKTNEECRGWQELLFDPLPVVYIKLVGTRNSINEVFHVVHLEAPSSVPISIK